MKIKILPKFKEMPRTSQDKTHFKKFRNSGIIFYVLSFHGDQLMDQLIDLFS